MGKINRTLSIDAIRFAQVFPYSTDLSGTSIVITGATGLIGSTLVRCLLALNIDIRIIAPVRSKRKASLMFGKSASLLEIIECDIIEYFSNLHEPFDYIIHCASPTSGSYMTEYPVETYELILESTRALLLYACKYPTAGVLFVSSLEYYGQNLDDNTITEEFLGYVDASCPRSSYPLGKRAAEFLCIAYAREFGVPVKIARLTQTLGAGVATNDNRVFTQFAKSIISGSDIVLHTTGESSKPYCYTTDAVCAILTILLKGTNGEAYNVANQDTYISIYNLAIFLRDNFNPKVMVVIDDSQKMGYAPVTKLHLSSEKLMKLGWKPMCGLKEMFSRLIESLEYDLLSQ